MFEDMPHVQGITKQRMKDLYVQTIEYFLDAAARTFAGAGHRGAARHYTRGL